jgi:hypothetical protein
MEHGGERELHPGECHRIRKSIHIAIPSIKIKRTIQSLFKQGDDAFAMLFTIE